MIPAKYLCKMGDYNITYDKGAPLKAKVVDKDKVIEELLPDYFGSEDVIGVDIKKFRGTDCYTNTNLEILVIYSYVGHLAA